MLIDDPVDVCRGIGFLTVAPILDPLELLRLAGIRVVRPIVDTGAAATLLLLALFCSTNGFLLYIIL